ncbi:nucleotide exchange factor GrpE [Actinomycetospora cinnamomea]|uniref:GrpE protein n=1 Tax=Actinomycetospora cinnamomea TaxID=663609 RepID=A0A2U1FCS3_9PSEU|nr:nucleotide exchange factor GrpE [Actinomycetospora cinnamomea]PVZ09954.1 GrpE protein [Actinomycetospora cinnamomea]
MASLPTTPHPGARGPAPDESVTAPVTLPGGADAAGERDALIALCIDLADRLRTTAPGLRARLHRGLAEVGVVPLEPDGRPFDRARHDAVDREPTTDPARDRTVASTERPGYADRGRVLRRPEVVVHALEHPGDPA